VAEVYRLMLDAEKAAGSKDAIAASSAVLAGVLKDKGLTY